MAFSHHHIGHSTYSGHSIMSHVGPRRPINPLSCTSFAGGVFEDEFASIKGFNLDAYVVGNPSERHMTDHLIGLLGDKRNYTKKEYVSLSISLITTSGASAD